MRVVVNDSQALLSQTAYSPRPAAGGHAKVTARVRARVRVRVGGRVRVRVRARGAGLEQGGHAEVGGDGVGVGVGVSEGHTVELQSALGVSYAVLCAA